MIIYVPVIENRDLQGNVTGIEISQLTFDDVAKLQEIKVDLAIKLISIDLDTIPINAEMQREIMNAVHIAYSNMINS